MKDIFSSADYARMADRAPAPGRAAGPVLPVGYVLGPYLRKDDFKAPAWALECLGQELPTTEYLQLFVAIGHRYGGESGRFHLPDLRVRSATCCIVAQQATVPQLPMSMGIHGAEAQVQFERLGYSELPTGTVLEISETLAVPKGWRDLHPAHCEEHLPHFAIWPAASAVRLRMIEKR